MIRGRCKPYKIPIKPPIDPYDLLERIGVFLDKVADKPMPERVKSPLGDNLWPIRQRNNGLYLVVENRGYRRDYWWKDLYKKGLKHPDRYQITWRHQPYGLVRALEYEDEKWLLKYTKTIDLIPPARRF